MLPDSLTKIIDEANINYQNSRFRDSANTFSNIASVCRRKGHILDGVYFSYRAALAHHEDNNGVDEIKELMTLIDHLIKSTLHRVTSLIPEIEDLRSKLQMMQRTERLLKLLGKKEPREQVIEAIIILCEQLIEESDLEARMEYIKIILSYSSNEKVMSEYQQKIFATYEMLGDQFAEKDDDYSKQMMGHSYGKAIRETSDYKSIGIIIDKLLKQFHQHRFQNYLYLASYHYRDQSGEHRLAQLAA